ncbi:carbon starvation CstA family protein [Nesterenkonia aerolata]|uniref:Carbon starvation protein A n=1 Tax=Nesterenkonia aerolata TaxID=3074079 RepID=A0ABU2DU82_9MICC|nr:carbon starvation protein A [Nesterenkonia sp. LY-0111]MDR8020054.1 carbon starvation protein A [Nesterenkonia sp. LY-0111]
MDGVNSLVLAVVGVVMMLAGYVLYSRFLAKRVYKLNAEFKTPGHEFDDGVDFVPTNKYVLWGHHFTSVAGAAPIVGPAVAVIWGWLPAFLWVVFGTVFLAGMHDLGSLWASARNKGQSIGTLSGRYIGARGRNLFLVVIFLLLLMVVAAFAVVISGLLVAQPGAVIPTWGALLVALLVGQAIYRFKMNLAVVSVVGVVALYGLILLGDRYPIELPERVMGLAPEGFWIVLLFVYAAIASILPVWVLLQPRDYINGIQLFIGLGILYGSVLIATPTVVAPAWNENVPADTPSIVPLLFVTIACGAISGFHGTVASGTSSKQMDRETDARFIGYFGAVGEGLLALGAIIATTAGFQSLQDWENVYESFSSGGVPVFVEGGGAIMNAGLGIPESLSATILATMAVLFAATTMDTGVRLKRFVIQEIGELAGVRLNTVVATLITVGIALALTFSQGGDGSGGMLIWPLFGTTNQLLAALTLMIITIILMRKGRPFLPVLIPALFVLVMSAYAAIVQLGTFYSDGDWLLLAIDVVIIIAAAWVLVESLIAMRRVSKEPKEPEDEQLLSEAEKLPSRER